MQNNWYIIYTKPQWEKKVAIALRRRKIENYLLLQKKQIISFRRIKTREEPLFQNYVFVNIEENQICKLKNIDGVINLVYWKGQPATIKHYEFEMLKDFILLHDNLTLEKTMINDYDVARVIDDFSYSKSGNLFTIKSTVAKISLPSIGFTLVAKVRRAGVVKAQSSFTEKELLLQS